MDDMKEQKRKEEIIRELKGYGLVPVSMVDRKFFDGLKAVSFQRKLFKRFLKAKERYLSDYYELGTCFFDCNIWELRLEGYLSDFTKEEIKLLEDITKRRQSIRMCLRCALSSLGDDNLDDSEKYKWLILFEEDYENYNIGEETEDTPEADAGKRKRPFTLYTELTIKNMEALLWYTLEVQGNISVLPLKPLKEITSHLEQWEKIMENGNGPYSKN